MDYLWYLDYAMSDKMKANLLNTLEKITDIKAPEGVSFIKYNVPSIDDKEHIIISLGVDAKQYCVYTLYDLYKLVIPEYDELGIRLQNYVKFRKIYKLTRAETLYTIASYLYINGITDKTDIVNRILYYIEKIS